MIEEDEGNFEKASSCWMCDQLFLTKSEYIFLHDREKRIKGSKLCPRLGEKLKSGKSLTYN